MINQILLIITDKTVQLTKINKNILTAPFIKAVWMKSDY